ncbi:MAG: glycosyltransferase [Desulfococcus multivorans]|jgi:glycosyltransferase involved in cell wall biosynthesis|uniref:glycosyltransferase family 2 protein n=1 Tax=Desulfococcus sp. TaxID=2025834 RepID=UPI002A39E792|nr:glycosyltransferase [Desulfococcus multivorans]
MISSSASPLISVIIPTHNRAWILRDAIDSVLSQKDCTFELIVVDDGSTDDTPELLRSYGNRLTAIRQENRGVSAARNLGIRNATGRFIAFLDSDDYWLPGKLAAQAAFFNGRSNALICQTQEIWIRNGVRVNPRKRHRKRTGMIFEPSLHLCLISPSAVMMHRSLFDVVGLFDESLPACEDYDLWLQISCRFPVLLVDAPLVVKRGGHPDQLSRTPGLDRFRIAALVKCIERAPLTALQRNAAIRVLADKCRIYGEGCLKRGRRDEAPYYLNLPHRYLSLYKNED